jgi:membrane peptidoglycan carboxypeptidase
MAEAYATIATGGLHRDAVAITRIEDRNGNLVYEHADKAKRVIAEEISAAALEVMKGVCNWGGTAETVLTGMVVDQPVAGKTGTSEDYRDLWFCGITPQLSVSVWCGYREEGRVMVWGESGHPSNTACPIFNYFVNAVLEGAPREEFPTSSTQPTYKDNSTWTFVGGQVNADQYYYNYNWNYNTTTETTESESKDTKSTEQQTEQTQQQTTDTTQTEQQTTDTTQQQDWGGDQTWTDTTGGDQGWTDTTGDQTYNEGGGDQQWW